MAKGGKIGFEGLSKKVAKRYVGKKVPKKFQNQYGKTYSPAEAKEVGDKVAGAVYRMQQAKKMAKGGEVKVVRYDVDFYDDKNAKRDTSVEEIIRANSIDDVVGKAIKRAKELNKKYIEFYHKKLFCWKRRP